MTTRAGPYVEDRIRAGARATCGHLIPCGCDRWHGCCTKCPLPNCALTSLPGATVKSLAQAPRNAAIVTASRSGAPIKDICDRFRLSRRRVFRVIQQARKGAPWPTH